MRKGRVIVILCLSLILCFMCVTTNTFSWFNRTEESGNKLVYGDKNGGKTLKQSSGRSFVVDTYMQGNGGEYSDQSIDKTRSEGAPLLSLSLEPGERQCYKTQITNNNTSNQNVSLYLSGVKSNDYTNTYVGVNNPMRTYKSLSSLNQAIISDTFSLNSRVFYVGFNKFQKYTPSQYKLRYYYDKNNYGDVELSANATGTGNDGASVLKDFGEIEITQLNHTYRTFAVVIPYGYTGAQLWHYGSNYFYKEQNDDIDTNNYMGLWKNGKDHITTNVNVGQSASIKCPSNITINKGGSCDLSSYFKGNKVVYKSENEDIAKVTDNKLIGIGAGHTSINVTCTGVLGETMTAKFNVEVQDVVEKFENVPVVTNMEVVPSTKDKQNVLTVYWYIKNTSSKSINVSVDKINVTL